MHAKLGTPACCHPPSVQGQHIEHHLCAMISIQRHTSQLHCNCLAPHGHVNSCKLVRPQRRMTYSHASASGRALLQGGIPQLTW
jgi:hypothetical protein